VGPGNNTVVIELGVTGGRTLMTIDGEFDIASEPEFKRTAQAALASGTRDFIIDLEGVTYLDGRALAALLSFFKSVSQAGGSVRIVTSNAFHRRLFSITGIDRVITLYGSRAQAEAAGESANRPGI